MCQTSIFADSYHDFGDIIYLMRERTNRTYTFESISCLVFPNKIFYILSS